MNFSQLCVMGALNLWPTSPFFLLAEDWFNWFLCRTETRPLTPSFPQPPTHSPAVTGRSNMHASHYVSASRDLQTDQVEQRSSPSTCTRLRMRPSFPSTSLAFSLWIESTGNRWRLLTDTVFPNDEAACVLLLQQSQFLFVRKII